MYAALYNGISFLVAGSGDDGFGGANIYFDANYGYLESDDVLADIRGNAPEFATRPIRAGAVYDFVAAFGIGWTSGVDEKGSANTIFLSTLTVGGAFLCTDGRRGGFREDPYYRLSVLRIRLASLREGPVDIEPTAKHLLA